MVYLDWMRGLAAAIMLQGHVFDAWARPQDRSGEWFWLSQFLGGLPAPIFLFLVGVSLALALDRMRQREASAMELAKKIASRSVWILFLAYAFRLEQYLVWYPASNWNDVFRVDTLNCIAVSTCIIGFLAITIRSRQANIVVMGFITAVTVLATPLVYPWRGALPGILLAYLNGNGNGSFFSVFPWIAFTLAGITFGYVLLHMKGRLEEGWFFKHVAVFGICSFAVGAAANIFPIFEYGYFDYSLTSPHYFLVRLGWILLILCGAYWWSARKGGEAWSPLRVMGQSSLLIYWLHIEIVYGPALHRFSKALTLSEAARQLAWLFPLMLGAALLAGAVYDRRGPSLVRRILTPARSSNKVTTAE